MVPDRLARRDRHGGTRLGTGQDDPRARLGHWHYKKVAAGLPKWVEAPMSTVLYKVRSAGVTKKIYQGYREFLARILVLAGPALGIYWLWTKYPDYLKVYAIAVAVLFVLYWVARIQAGAKEVALRVAGFGAMNWPVSRSVWVEPVWPGTRMSFRLVTMPWGVRSHLSLHFSRQFPADPAIMTAATGSRLLTTNDNEHRFARHAGGHGEATRGTVCPEPDSRQRDWLCVNPPREATS
jgi:hypothetical protein